MKLTRRDAMAALSAAAGSAVAGCSAPTEEYGESADETAEPTLNSREMETLETLAGILYPSDAENVEGFVDEYATQRVRQDPDHGRGVLDAIERLDEYTETIYGERFTALSPAEQEETLAQMPVATADPVPDGSDAERVRYFLVNDLLYAFYASPTGASLAGLENPPGYPGGTSSYKRGPQ
jgi:hypothetical protein